MEIEREGIFPSIKRKGVQCDDGTQQDSPLDRLEELDEMIKNFEINPKKFHGIEQKPKTANKAFGGISDFALFFENRNPEMKEFTKEFEKIEKMDSGLSIVELNGVIVPKIDACLDQMYQKIQVTAKSKSEKRENKYAGLFQSLFKTWEEFYSQVFRAYTINGFLYEKMNNCLRNENWMELDILLPYVYCLFKAFLWKPTGLTLQESFETLKAKSKENKLILYRGADFDDESLKFYDPNKIKSFSWNGVTSTSLHKEITKKFQGDPSKRPILITIEIDFEDLRPENLNALYLAEFSKYPKEQEVVLPPGSIFELLEINKEKPEAEMRLRLVTNAKVLAHQGKIMHGMFQERMRNEGELKIPCLQGKELSRAIRHCQGNKLIRNLEFCFCIFNENVVEVFKEVFPTIKKLSSLILDIAIFEENCGLDRLLECLGKTNVKEIQIFGTLNEEREILHMINGMKYLSSLNYLKLSFKEDCRMNANLFKDLFEAGCQYLNSECFFDIDIGTSYNLLIKGLNLHDLEQSGVIQIVSSNWPTGWGSPPKTLLETESLAYNSQLEHHLERTTIAEARSLNQIEIENTQILENLEVKDREKSSVEIIESLTAVPKYCFRGIKRGTLREVFENRLKFTSEKTESERRITDSKSQEAMQEEFKSQSREGTEQLELLTSLHVIFEECKIKDGEISLLCSHGLRHFQSLTALELVFYHISDKGLKILSYEGIKHLKSLTYLHLDLRMCSEITDLSFSSLCSEGIQYLRSLTSLNLNFGYCDQITDEGLKTLGSEGLRNLRSLTSLHLNLRMCFAITDLGFSSLCSEGIQHLQSLTSLDLNFGNCEMITDGGLKILGSEGLRNLQLLTSLNLNFGYCNQITDKGFKALCSEGIKYLRSLTSLYLDFEGCNQIRDVDSNQIPISNCSIPFSKSSLLKLSNPNKNTAFVIYQNVSGFYLKDSPLNCEQSIRQLLKSHSPFDSQDLDGVFSQNNRSEQIQRSDDATFHLNFKSDLIDDSFTNYENIAFSWQDVKTLNLVFSDCQLLSAQRHQSYWNIPRYFKSIVQLHLSSNEASFPLDEILKSLFHDILQSLKSLRSINCIFSNTSMSKTVQKHILKASSESVNLIFFTKRKFEPKTTGLQVKKQIPQISLCKRKCQRDETKIQKTQISAQRNIENRNFLFEDLIEMNSNQCINQKDFNKEIIDDLHKNWKMELKLALQTESIFLSDFKSLLKLSLNFFGCSDTTNERLKNLSIGISCLKTLDILDLSFYGCRRVTDEGLSSFVYQGLKQLGQLTEISLDFGFCTGITDNGVDYLAREGINHLKKLTKLELGFKWNQYVTDRGLENLSENLIKNLKLLTDLRLSFNDCTEVTDIGLHSLSYDGIPYLESLKFLSLDFCGCQKISDQGLKSLSCGAASRLQSLTHLDLSFGADNSNGITDEGFWGLCHETVFPLKSLLSLRLKIHIPGGVSDGGLESLFCEGLQNLEVLTSLEFISPGENRITERGIISIAFKGMSRLIQLENLQISLSQIFTVSSSLYEAFNRILVYFGLKEREDEGF